MHQTLSPKVPLGRGLPPWEFPPYPKSSQPQKILNKQKIVTSAVARSWGANAKRSKRLSQSPFREDSENVCSRCIHSALILGARKPGVETFFSGSGIELVLEVFALLLGANFTHLPCAFWPHINTDVYLNYEARKCSARQHRKPLWNRCLRSHRVQ